MKITKVFWNGKRLKDIYVGATPLQVLKYRLRVGVLRFIQGATIAGILYLAAVATVGFMTPNVWASNEIIIDKFPEKIESLKDDVVNQLMSCESAGHDEDDGIIIFDTNNKASIGQAQFQVKTVIYYYKKLYGKDITPKEAILIALDQDKAASLAKDIIFKADGLGNWYNCTKKLGLDSQVAVIKKLEK